MTGQFIRRGRQSQDRTELLLAQLQDAREGEAAAAALAERSRIAGELHDVLAHSLSGLAIQLQGARKMAAREAVSEGLRAALVPQFPHLSTAAILIVLVGVDILLLFVGLRQFEKKAVS